MAWWLLIPAFIAFIIGAYFSYNDEQRRSPWFYPVYLSVSVACSLIWIVSAKCLDNKRHILVYSVFWDSLLMVAYYLLPLLFFGVKVNTGMLVGIALVLIGIMLVKAYA
jgi:uncharacterized membrane protein